MSAAPQSSRNAGSGRRFPPGRLRDLLVAVFLAFAAVVSFLAFRDFVFEDAYITYRYAGNLAEGRGFVFNPGERVLGTTTPLLALLLGGLALLGMPPHVGGVVVFVVALSVVGWLGYRILTDAGLPTAGVLFSVAMAWGAGSLFKFVGMETPLYVALLLGAVLAAASRRPWLTGLLLGALILTRYDGILGAGAVLGCRLVLDRSVPWRAAMACSALVAPWLLFAWLYFGSPLPNTLSAKSSDVAPMEYFAEAASGQVELLAPRRRFGLQPNAKRERATVAILLLPVALFTRRLWRRSPWLVALVAYSALLWIGYGVLRPPPRHSWHLLPATYCLLLASAGAWGDLLARLARAIPGRIPAAAAGRAATWLLVAASFVFLAGRAEAEAEREKSTWIYSYRVESYELIAEWILRHRFEDASLYTLEPGYLTYRTGQPAIDGAGLVTPGIRYHGNREERTPTSRILAAYRPDLVVLDLSPARDGLQGYRPVLQSPSGKELLLRDDLWAERFPQLYDAWVRSSYFPEEPAHVGPVRWDFEEGVPDLFTCRPWSCATWPGWAGSRSLGTRPRLGMTQAIWTQPFRVDFDELRFRFAADGGERTRAQVLVDGWLVFEARGRGDLVVRELAAPLYPYRGRSAVLRLVDAAPPSRRLEIDDVRSVEYESVRVLDDFEGPGWSDLWAEGFGPAPVSNAPLAREAGLPLAQGRGIASTLHLEGQRTLVSRPFLLDRGRLGFSFFDHSGDLMRVELLVDGEVVRSLAGRGTGEIRWVTWDVGAFRESEAVVRASDWNSRSDRGLALDSLILYDEPAPDSAPAPTP